MNTSENPNTLGDSRELGKSEKEIQAAIWALVFQSSEQALAFRALRDQLAVRGVLNQEDQDAIDAVVQDNERLQHAYGHLEKAFREKFARVHYAFEHPEEMTPESDQTGFEVNASFGTTAKTIDLPSTTKNVYGEESNHE